MSLAWALVSGKWDASNPCHAMTSQLFELSAWFTVMIVSAESALGTQMTATTDHYGSNEDCEYLDF